MSRRSVGRDRRGFFEIGIAGAKTPMNIGTLWRSAYQLGAAGIFTIGHRYPRQHSDTYKTPRHIPLRQFDDAESFWEALPNDAPVVAVEMGGADLWSFRHPERAVYLLGAEDHGIPKGLLEKCHVVVSLSSLRVDSYNVAVAGSIVMYHRMMQRVAKETP